MSTLTPNFKELPISERIELVEDIWDSIAEETPDSLHLSPEERSEPHRRLADHVADPASGIPWEEVRASLLKS